MNKRSKTNESEKNALNAIQMEIIGAYKLHNKSYILCWLAAFAFSINTIIIA